MNNNYKTPKILLTAVVAAGLAFAASSCHKENSSNNTTATVTEANAAQMTTDAVSPETGGMVGQLNSSLVLSDNTSLACGVQKDSTLTFASAAGASPFFSYTLAWNYTLTCSNDVPSMLTFNFTGNGSYSGSFLSSSFSSTGGFVLSGLGAGATQYLYTSTYSRKGTTTFKAGNQNTFNSNITIVSNNIIVSKTTSEILSGTATVTITATSTSGKSWNYGGTLTFLGNKTGKVVLNSGITYNISWL